jgi:hypothetical protein
LTLTTEDRCDSARWVSGGIIDGSITGTIGDTSSFYGTNSHFEYTNDIGDVEFTVYYDPWQRYDDDFAFGPDKNEDAAQVELEAQFSTDEIDIEAAMNELKDFRIEASRDFDDSVFRLLPSHEASTLDETKSVVILWYRPKNVRFLMSVSLGYEKSLYEYGEREDNLAIMFRLADKKWKADIGYNAKSDFALEAFYFGLSFAHEGETGEKSYEIGMGFSF